jgi:hypothetical protein
MRRVLRIGIALLTAASITQNYASAAIKLIPNKSNFRFNNSASSLTFKVGLSDDIPSLKGTGTINAKMKFDSSLFTSNLTNNLISIPYVDGVIGDSPDITLTLKNPSITKSNSSPFSVKFSGAQKKKLKLVNFADKFNIDASSIQVSGRVTIPEASASNFKTRTAKLLKARKIAPSNTDNPDGVLVELLPINPATGEASGPAIAEAITDTDGTYNLEMPAGTEFGTDYALVVQGDNGENMHAPLFGDSVNITPATETLFQLTQDAVQDPTSIGLGANDEISFENFTDTEALGLNNQLENLTPIYEPTLSASIQSLKDTYASFLNNMLGASADDDTSGVSTDIGEAAKGIAGDYFVSFFNTAISSESRLRISVELASARMSKPDEVGALVVTPFPSFSSEASSQVPQNRGPGPDQGPRPDQGQGSNARLKPLESTSCYDVEAYSEGAREVRGTENGNFYMTVDANRIINFVEPAMEEPFRTPEGQEGSQRYQPSVMNMIPVGEGMFLSGMRSTDTTLLEGNVQSTEYNAGFGSIIKKSSLTAADLSGAYGMVGLGYEVRTEAFGSTALIGDLSFNSNQVDFDMAMKAVNVAADSCGGSTYTLTRENQEQTGSANLAFQNGRINMTVESQPGSETIFTGFARPDAKVLSLIYANDSGAQGSREDRDGRSRNVISDAQRQLMIGVKKPTSLLNLSGKSYRIISMNFGFNELGGRTVKTGELGTLSFSGATLSLSNFTKEVFTKDTANSETVAVSTSITNNPAVSYSLDAQGKIDFTLGSETLTGYVADDASLIVLSSDENSSLGVYFAILNQ